MAESHEERFEREQEYWTGPKLFGALIATLLVALTVIYTMASHPGSQPSQEGPWNWSWSPFGTDPGLEINQKPSSVSGLTR